MADQPPADYTVAELREWLSPRLHEPGGTTCPVCRQHAQAYKRKPSLEMARTAARMLAEQGKLSAERPGWVHLPDIEQRTRDVATLAYWNLIVENRDDRGWWRVTADGEAWLRGDGRIPEYVHVYNGKARGFSGAQITVYDVAPKFDLDALMRGE